MEGTRVFLTITLHEISRTFNMAATSAIEVHIAINRMHISSRLDLTERKTRYLLSLSHNVQLEANRLYVGGQLSQVRERVVRG